MEGILDFFNKKSDCNICGAKDINISKLKTKDGVFLCMSCLDQLSLEDDSLADYTSQEMSEHMKYREKNKEILDSFRHTKKIDCSYGDFLIDENKELFYYIINKGERIPKDHRSGNPPVFSFDELMGYEISINGNILEREEIEDMVAKGETYGELNSLSLRIFLSNKYHGSILIEVVKDHKIKDCSMSYKIYTERVDSIVDELEKMMED